MTRRSPSEAWFGQLHAGNYDVTILMGGKTQLELQGVAVQAEQECDDARLRAIDWTSGMRVVRLRARNLRGDVVRPRLVMVKANEAQGRSMSSIADEEILALRDGEERFVLGDARYCTVLVDKIEDDMEVTMPPRRSITIVAPAGLKLPVGTAFELRALAFPQRYGRPSRAICTGPAVSLLADGEGRHRIDVRAPQIGSGKILWSGEIPVGAGGAAREVELPITAEQLQELRRKLAATR